MARKRIKLDPARPVASFIEAAPAGPDGEALTRYGLGMLQPNATASNAPGLVQSAERSAGNIGLDRLVRLLDAAGYDVVMVAVKR